MATISPPTRERELPGPIAQQLSRLRRSMKGWLAADGLSRVLLLVVAVVLVDLAIDWFFRFDRVQRVWLMVMAIGLVTWVTYRRLVRPLTVPLDDEALCLAVESRHRELGESLISAVQFSRRGLSHSEAAALGLSPAMVRATVDDGTQRASSIDFGDVLDDFKFRRNMLLAFLAAAALVGIAAAVAFTEPMRIWFDRNVLLGESEWPQKTYLKVVGVAEDGSLALPRGDDWLQVVEASGEVIPSLVYLDFQPLGGRRSIEQMKQVGSSAFHTTFKNMLEEFRFRAHGGDATTPWIDVRLVDRPAVEQLTLTLEPPAYTAGKSEVLPPGAGPYPALKGSQLRVSGQANKDLSQARLKWGENSQQVTIDGRSFQTVIGPEQLAGLTYALELKDTDQLESKRPTRFSVTIKADREPTIRARLDGISGMIVPGARVPIGTTIQDDFAITAARLQYQWRAEGSEGGGSSGALKFEEIAAQYGQPRISYEYSLDTKPLGLQIGSNLSFHVEALDNDNVSAPSGQPGKIGRSDNFLLRVVSEEELRADLLRREKERRMEVERLLKDQEDLQTETRAILATVLSAETSAEQRSNLIKTQKRQHVAADRAESVARQLTQLVREVANNYLEEENGPIQVRMDRQIIAPLELLGAESIPAASRLLDEARRAAGEPEVRNDHLSKAIEQQDQIVQSLREILRHMAKSEGYQEAVNLLYAILKSQGDVNQMTLKEAQSRIRDIFKDDSSGSGAR